jgi:predicted acyltransferase
MSVPNPTPGRSRIESLDQFRGWAIVAMILVDFLGRFHSMPETFRHHRIGFSFADTVAPFFIFVVGTGFCISFHRRVREDGLAAARRAALQRYLILVLIGVFVYGPDLRMHVWDALTDIGFAGLLCLPVIGRGLGYRLGAAVLYLVLFQSISDLTPYGNWLSHNSIDGGPLGPLSWAFPLILGTVVWDYYREGKRKVIMCSLIWGLSLTAVGFALSYHWPFSQRMMSCSYAVASSGLCFLAFLVFYLVADVWKRPLPHLTTIGKNALTVYVLHLLLVMVWHDQGQIFPKEASPWVALAGFVAIYFGCYAVALYMERHDYFIRI